MRKHACATHDLYLESLSESMSCLCMWIVLDENYDYAVFFSTSIQDIMTFYFIIIIIFLPPFKT